MLSILHNSSYFYLAFSAALKARSHCHGNDLQFFPLQMAYIIFNETVHVESGGNGHDKMGSALNYDGNGNKIKMFVIQQFVC